MCQFFKKRGYPDSAVTTGKHRAQEIDRETALQTSQNEETDRIPFTLTYHPQNLAIKNVIILYPLQCLHNLHRGFCLGPDRCQVVWSI